MKSSMCLTIGLILSLFSHPSVKAQTPRIDIPIGLEAQPTGRDSYLPYYRLKRPRIMLALSGGGARGLAQIGVLKVFEEHGIPIDGIVGNSMGAIVGGLVALGYTAAEIESLAYQIRWDQIIRDTPPRQQLFMGQKEERATYIFQIRLKGFSFDIPSSITAGQQLTSLITDLVLNAPYPMTTDFDKLYVPFRAIATDLLTGQKVVLKQGSLIDALCASMTIPLLFSPVRKDSALLVDGGLLENLPVSDAQAMGADLVIAIDTSSKLRQEKLLKAPWEIADQVTTIMQQDRVLSQLDSADVAIQPILGNISNTDFDQIDVLIRAGEAAAQKAIPLIEQSFIQSSFKSELKSFPIKDVIIVGCMRLDPKTFLDQITMDISSPVSQNQITWSGRALFQTGLFRNVTASMDTSTSILTYTVEEHPFINKVVINGNRVFSDSTLVSGWETIPGKILNIHKGRKDLRKLMTWYHQSGYALATIDSIQIEKDVLRIDINEGIISKIQLKGNEQTRPFVILRELPLKTRDIFDVDHMKQGIENIYSTGYFESVRFDLLKKNHDYTLVLNLAEQEYTLVRMGLRYDLERRTQGFVHTVKENLLGAGLQGSLIGLLGNRDRMIQARLWSDRLFNSLITYRAHFSMHKRDFNYYKNHIRIGSYAKTHLEGSVSLGQQMRRLGTISVQLRTERIELEATTGESTPENQFNAINITLRSVVDTRDKVPFPQTGKYHILEYETAGKYLGSEVSYTKLFSSMESYFPLHPSVVFHPKFFWGTADHTTPFPKQFRLGGLVSFIGIPEETFIGKRFFTLSGELRYRFPWPRWLESYLSIRYDFGGIWGSYSKITTDDFKHGMGAILSFNTPLGPFRLGYGYMSDGVNHAYFSAGYKF